MGEMKSLVSRCSIFVIWQILYRRDDISLVWAARVFDFNDFGSYLSKTILTSLYLLDSFVITLIEHSVKSKEVRNWKVLILKAISSTTTMMAFPKLVSKTPPISASNLSG